MSERLVSISKHQFADGYVWDMHGSADGWAPTYREALASLVAALIREGSIETARGLLAPPGVKVESVEKVTDGSEPAGEA